MNRLLMEAIAMAQLALDTPEAATAAAALDLDAANELAKANPGRPLLSDALGLPKAARDHIRRRSE